MDASMHQCLYLLLLCLVIAFASADEVTIQTKLGNITGVSLNADGKIVNKFMGIPYAKPPVGDLRFAKPELFGNFPKGGLNATDFGSICSQINSQNSKQVGSEDCLFLNIFKPSPTATNKSVMIWIHGGSFTGGSSNVYPAEILSTVQDVVVVTINYRLNVFGFLSTQDSTLPGNYGLWDQWLAIQWVKNNIEEYGGNSDSITLFGESAGGFAITYQMVSPHNNVSVFRRAITESGSGLSIKILLSNPTTTTDSVSKAIGCNEKHNFLKCLRSKSMSELLSTTVKPGGTPLEFTPVLDDDFLPKQILEQLVNFAQNPFSSKIDLADFANYDVMGGWNSQDGLLYAKSIDALNNAMTGKNLSDGISAEVLTAALKTQIVVGLNNRTALLIADIYSNYYINSPYLSLPGEKMSLDQRRLQIFIKIAGNVILMLPTVQHLQLHSAISSKNTFAYEFDHKRRSTPGLWYEGPAWLRTGADHADEIVYVFGIALMSDKLCNELEIHWCGNYTDDEKALATNMTQHWANFAKNGNPGSDFVKFEYPQSQTYTVLRTEGIEKLDYPLSAELRLRVAVDVALQQQPALPSDNNATDSYDGEDEYLSGLLTLTREEVKVAFTGVTVIAILLAVICLLLAASVITLKCKARRSAKV